MGSKMAGEIDMHLFICPKCHKTNQIPDSEVNRIKKREGWVATAKCKYCLSIVEGNIE
jgi:hypothetical protein